MKTNASGRKDNGNPNRDRTLYLINVIILCLMTLAALCACFFMLLRYRKASRDLSDVKKQIAAIEGKDKTLYTADELESRVAGAKVQAASQTRSEILMQIQSSLESGNSTAAMLRGIFPDDIVVVSGGRYYFYPVLSGLAANGFRSSDFKTDEAGVLQYVGDDEDVSITRGVDISSENGEIDWPAAAEGGISFAMIRAAGRDQNGVLYTDRRLDANIRGAAKAGINVGVYFETPVTGAKEGREDAEYLASVLEDYKSQISYPVAVMMTEPENEDGEEAKPRLKKSERTQAVLDFCDAAAESGYRTLVYGNLAQMIMRVDIDKLEGYSKWIASYDGNLYFPYRFSMWQYSTTGQVQGIKGNVSLDATVLRR